MKGIKFDEEERQLTVMDGVNLIVKSLTQTKSKRGKKSFVDPNF